MDKIYLHNLVFYGVHGCYEHERIAKQPFKIHVELGIPLKKAGQSDNLEDTVDWATLKKDIQDSVENESFLLVEALAEHIARVLLESSEQIKEVNVRVDKLAGWDNGYRGVEITRKRA